MTDPTFSLCLTHDVDRPYKCWHQSVYYALAERSLSQIRSLLPGANPYWQFEEIMALEADLGVRSAFYFLGEPPIWKHPPREWLHPSNWVQHLGRYDIEDTGMADMIRRLDEGGWEVGLHGSYHSASDPDRLRAEKERIESVLGHPVRGGRQHHLRMEMPDTWQVHADIGLEYDSSLGSSTDYGFGYGHSLREPLDEPFTVFPLTLMEQTLPDPDTDPDAAWAACDRLLTEAAENGGVLTVVWHPRYFNESEFPGYRRLYRRLIEEATDLGAWVGPPAALLDRRETNSATPQASPVIETD